MSNVEDEYGPAGLAQINSGKILVRAPVSTFRDAGDTFITKIFIHELGHLFDADDHYDSEAYGVPASSAVLGQDRDCIYGEDNLYIDDFDLNVTCEYCTNTILENADMYNHP